MATDANSESCQRLGGEEDALRDDPLDIFHLRRFTLGDRRLELEILKLFIDQAPLTIAALQDARNDHDWLNAAHTLKGSARAVGAWRLADLAERAERLGTISDKAACERMLRQLEKATEEARDHIAVLGEPDELACAKDIV
jgi:HPt (histidine-containing phosphotransfer) domain-containing protein